MTSKLLSRSRRGAHLPYGFTVRVALSLVMLREVALMDVPEEDARL